MTMVDPVELVALARTLDETAARLRALAQPPLPAVYHLPGERAALATLWESGTGTSRGWLDQVIAEADRRLTAGPWSVTTDGGPPASVHALFGSSPHTWWTENPYTTDGVLDPNAHRADYAAAREVARTMVVLGAAFTATGDRRYADRAGLIGRRWAVDATSLWDGRVDLSYSKIEPMLTFPGLLCGLALIDDTLPDDLRTTLRSWVVATAKSMTTASKLHETYGTDSARGVWPWRNNFELWHCACLAAAGAYADDDGLLDIAVGRFQTALRDQLRYAGRAYAHLPAEATRTRSLDYHCHALSAIMHGAHVLARNGRPIHQITWADPTGRMIGVRDLVATLIPHMAAIDPRASWVTKTGWKQINAVSPSMTDLGGFRLASQWWPDLCAPVLARWARPLSGLYGFAGAPVDGVIV